MRIALALLGLTLLSACTPYEQAHTPPIQPPQINAEAFTPGDGAKLPLQCWHAARPRAVVAALHGFNDYHHAFEEPARYFTARGITTCAIDQRGFGAAPETGRWAGRENLISDAKQLVNAIHAKWPRTPVFLMGESMGGAVAAVTMAQNDPPAIQGLILSAPALWGDEDFNPLFRIPLWVGAHTFPWYKLTGEDVDVMASDNIEMLRALGRDPLVIKETRIDAILGLVRLMDEAHGAAPHIRVPTLLLYGEHDEIIPPEPVYKFADNLRAPREFIVYPDGWHMLERDLQRETVQRDIVRWVLKHR